MGGGLAAANEVRLAAKIAYLGTLPAGDNLTELSDEVVFGSFSLANGLRVGDMHIVLVQGPLESIKVPGLESLAPFLDEFDLWRDGHCDE